MLEAPVSRKGHSPGYHPSPDIHRPILCCLARELPFLSLTRPRNIRCPETPAPVASRSGQRLRQTVKHGPPVRVKPRFSEDFGGAGIDVDKVIGGGTCCLGVRGWRRWQCGVLGTCHGAWQGEGGRGFVATQVRKWYPRP